MTHKEIPDTTKRSQIIHDHLLAHGITSLEEAPDELIEEAEAEADDILGPGNDN